YEQRFFDDVAESGVEAFKQEMLAYLWRAGYRVFEAINATGNLSDEDAEGMLSLLQEFMKARE
ncbi:MAG: hypothetical protein LBC69_00805, partial [Eubacteriaceae bacterium]|nr:hypothetical protein [Eubacteriaceae bacterium]